MISLICRMLKKQNKTKLIDREQIGGCHRWGVGRWGVGEEGQKVQTCSYKSWGCNVQHGDYS